MQFKAQAKFLRFSPYKLRPLVDVVRGKHVQEAMNWLLTTPLKRAVPVRKMIQSAAANAKDLQNIPADKLLIKEIRVDEGPTRRYFKPGAMGRATVLRKRTSHISIILESVGN